MAKQSVTISFVTAESDFDISVDMDDEKNFAANNERTSSFIFGDEAFFRVFTKPISGVSISCYQSDGVLTSYGIESVSIQEYLTFTEAPESAGGVIEDNTASLSKPVYSGFVVEGLPQGSSPCGVVSLSLVEPDIALASQAGPGVYDANYVAQYHSFSIKKDSIPTGFPSDEPYPIVIVIVGT